MSEDAATPPDALRRDLKRVLAKLAARQRGAKRAPAEPAPAPRKILAKGIRELAMDGLDNAAIAAAMGIPLSTVSATLSYARRRMKMEIPAQPRAGAGFLVHLDADVRAALASLAKRRGVRAHELAAALIGSALGGGEG